MMAKGEAISCGCGNYDKPRYKDESGKRYGRLLVVEYAYTKKGAAYWKCQCDCGGSVVTQGASLRRGYVESCGCLQSELVSKRMKGSIPPNKKYNKYDLSGNCGVGFLSDGEKFYFDKEDYDKIKRYYWRKNDSGYLIGGYREGNVRIHRVIMNLMDVSEPFVDHKDRNPLNNRKENLRLCNDAENAFNNSLRSDNTSGFTGVSYNKCMNKWETYICIGGNLIKGGYYKNIEEAVRVRLNLEKEHFGEFAPQQHLLKKYGI